jgi:hypothetical protein
VIELEQFFNNLAHTLSVRLNEIITTLRTHLLMLLDLMMIATRAYEDNDARICIIFKKISHWDDARA